MFHRDFNGVDPHPLLPCPLSQSATSTWVLNLETPRNT
jgi:hypothetical protein